MRSDLSHKGRGDAERVETSKTNCVPLAAGRVALQNLTQLHYVAYFAAVFLFAMLTTCTRRFTSASGLAGSLSLLLP